MNLEEPGAIGGLEIPNRGVFRPVRTRFVNDGVPTPALATHLATRADGGAGLVVGPAQMLVHPSASGPSYINAHDDAAIEGLEVAVDAVHETGSAIIGQLTHTGAEETGDWEMQPQLAPSASASNAAYEMPKAMDDADVRAVRDGFVAAAENLETAGFDGIELNAGPSSVLRQFLSPRYNVRTDEYGGDWECRARFVNDVLDAVNTATAGPVGLHLSLAELEYGGYEFDDVPALLDALEGFDYLSCTVGTRATLDQTHAGLAVPAPDLLEPIQVVTESVDVPVMGRQPRTTASDADTLLEAGADFVCFTRQLLADERTIQKLTNGDRHERCIECNQKCLEGVYGHAHSGHVECVINPRTGRESELPALADAEPAALPRQILVVGGGPAGMRFAAIAARRGHDVTIREANDELGGQLRLAARGPLVSLTRAREDLETALHEAGVTVELESRVSVDSIESDWDTVVVATGAMRPNVDSYGFDGDVIDAFEVLEGVSIGDDVLLFDDNRWVIAFQAGLRALDEATAVELVTIDHYPGFTTEQPNLPGFVAALQAEGATFTGNHTLEAVDADGTATLRNTLTGERTTRTPDTIVVAGRRQATEDLYLELKDRRDSVYRIGDAVSPRKLDRAYYDGELLARRL